MASLGCLGINPRKSCSYCIGRPVSLAGGVVIGEKLTSLKGFLVDVVVISSSPISCKSGICTGDGITSPSTNFPFLSKFVMLSNM